jgi:hypothetical protein
MQHAGLVIQVKTRPHSYSTGKVRELNRHIEEADMSFCAMCDHLQLHCYSADTVALDFPGIVDINHIYLQASRRLFEKNPTKQVKFFFFKKKIIYIARSIASINTMMLISSF